MNKKYESQFHASEIAVQKRLGVDELVSEYAPSMILALMPDGYRRFFAQLPWVILGAIDNHGSLWAIPLFGSQGFIQSPDNMTLRINVMSGLFEAFRFDINPGQKAALLGIDLATRRRIRVNGSVESRNKKGFTIHVEQCYGNCPKYIQSRKLRWQDNKETQPSENNFEFSKSIPVTAKKLIETSDTFFIASRSREFTQDRSTGIDVSHRGGQPGFVKVEDNVIYFPDFSGNRFFNTLGNIESDGSVGLFFPNFLTSEVSFISGKAEIIWDHKSLPEFEGAERIIKVTTEQSVYICHGLEMTAELIELSSVLGGTGTWHQVKRK